MRNVLLGALLLTALAAPAHSADLRPVYKAPPPVPFFSWAGLYVGGNVGYGWGQWDGDPTYYDPLTGGAPLQIFFPPNRTVDAKGWLAGGQVGFNYQINSFVFGLEA